MKNHRNYLELIEILYGKAKMEKEISKDVVLEKKRVEDEELERVSEFFPN